MKTVLTWLFGLALAFSLPLVALAQPVPIAPSPDDLGGFIQAVISAVVARRWGYVLAFSIIGGIALAKTYGSKVGPGFESFLKSDPGGVLLAMASSFAAAIYAGGGALNADVLKHAAGTFADVTVLFVFLTKVIGPLFWSKLFPPSGSVQASAIVKDAAAVEAKANAAPVAKGSAAGSLDSIK